VSDFRIRIAGRLDLPAINSIIDQAVTSWNTTERVKRLALPAYRYHQDDIDHMWLLAAEGRDGALAGVAALEEADGADLPVPGYGLLLHGLYVKPEAMGIGAGRALLETSAGICREMGYPGLLVKAIRHSRGFFEHCGLQACQSVRDTDYPHRYWLSTCTL
jgi:GNAT superfamily N-acetyltransferase